MAKALELTLRDLAPADATGQRALDVEAVERLVRTLTTGTAEAQYQAVAECCTHDVVLDHILLHVEGKRDFYSVYRLASLFLDYQLEVVDVVAQGSEKMCIWVNLNVRPRGLPFPRVVAPDIVFLHFRQTPDGRTCLCHQFDHHSVFGWLWGCGIIVMPIAELIVRPLSGRLLSLAGRLADTVSSVLRR